LGLAARCPAFFLPAVRRGVLFSKRSRREEMRESACGPARRQTGCGMPMAIGSPPNAAWLTRPASPASDRASKAQSLRIQGHMPRQTPSRRSEAFASSRSMPRPKRQPTELAVGGAAGRGVALREVLGRAGSGARLPGPHSGLGPTTGRPRQRRARDRPGRSTPAPAMTGIRAVVGWRTPSSPRRRPVVWCVRAFMPVSCRESPPLAASRTGSIRDSANSRPDRPGSHAPARRAGA